MSASFLLSECLENIFLNLLDENPISTKYLHSCTLVSRHWCRISTPFLYAYPFHYVRHLAYSKYFSSYFKLIRTLLNCVPKSEIEQIILNSSKEQEFSLPDTLTTFNYITFIRGLIFNIILPNPFELSYYKEIWFPYISNYDNTTQYLLFSKIINHLVKFMCKHCSNLTKLEFPFTIQKNNEFFDNMIELLTFEDFNRKNKLSDLKELYYFNGSNGSRFSQKDVYLALSNDICNLNLLCNEGITSIKIANSLSKFISLQKRLQHIILTEKYNVDDGYNIVFNSLSTQSESLQILEFAYLSFCKINKEALNSLCLLKNIKGLKLYYCKINDDLNYWAENLTRLEVFEFMTYYFSFILEDFLIQLVQSSSNTLTKLVLYYKREQDGLQLFKLIPLCLHSLIHLELPKIFPTELISIFKSCTQLVYLSTILSSGMLWGEIFGNLGKFIPKNLKKIQFKGMDYLVFNSNELKCFFEECVNSNSKLKHLEIIGCYDFGQEYFDIAKEFHIELIKA